MNWRIVLLIISAAAFALAIASPLVWFSALMVAIGTVAFGTFMIEAITLRDR